MIVDDNNNVVSGDSIRLRYGTIYSRESLVSYSDNEPHYRELVRAFVDGEISPSEFVTRYMKLWRSDRDEDWSDPELSSAFTELARALAAGEISRDERTAGMQAALAKRTGNQPLAESLDRIFTACDAIEDGEALREFVAKEWQVYEAR